MDQALRIGTCSWNYDSWVGVVYDEPRSRSVDYLADYAKKYNLVEVDSWFYKLPTRHEVEEYAAAVPPSFEFVCKAPRDISLTHFQNDQASANPAYLSVDLYEQFLESLDPIAGQIPAIILEFEYLNKKKMPGQAAFMDQLGAFIAAVPKRIPLAIECRNGPWLNKEWFQFLQQAGAMPVLSEKQFLPPIVDLGSKYMDLFGQMVVVWLLGGDRKEIEERAGGQWDKIVEPKESLAFIAGLINDLINSGRSVRVDVNNHFEGSAPETINHIHTLQSGNRVIVS
jgi:uncharacterized protein YecE (DUF72 family)